MKYQTIDSMMVGDTIMFFKDNGIQNRQDMQTYPEVPHNVNFVITKINKSDHCIWIKGYKHGQFSIGGPNDEYGNGPIRISIENLQDKKDMFSIKRNEAIENILLKAAEITKGARQSAYGSPAENFHQAAKIFNSIRGHEKMSAEDMAWALFAVKISREQNKHKEDNMVDLAGYAWVINEIIKESGRE